MVSKCFLCCTDVRYVSRIVAIMDFVSTEFRLSQKTWFDRFNEIHTDCVEHSMNYIVRRQS